MGESSRPQGAHLFDPDISSQTPARHSASSAPVGPVPPAWPHPNSGQDRWNRGAWLFRDSTLKKLEILLDEAFRIPGTGVRFGLDGIVGLIPGFGDVLAGLLSLAIPLAAWLRRVTYVSLVRMVVNVGIGVVIGSIPLFGDIFDIVWMTNRRNYNLLSRHLSEPRRKTTRDWIFLASLVCILGLIFVMPVLIILWIFTWALGSLQHP